MKRTFRVFLITALGIFISALFPKQSFSLVIDHSTNPLVTVDVTNGLEFLDFTETIGMSINEVTEELVDSGAFHDWRYATMGEVWALWLSADALDSGNMANGDRLVGLLGEPGVDGFAGFHADSVQEHSFMVAVTSHAWDPDFARWELSPEDAFTWPIASTQHLAIGSYLVRTASIPEPSPLLLLGISLICLVVTKISMKAPSTM